MRIAIVYDSRTGKTRAAAIAMGRQFEEQGHSCQVQSVSEADPARVAEADMVCVGSWTRGLFFFLQSATPATVRFIESLGDLAGKQALVFATYKISTGSMLPKMAEALRRRGAEVVGHFQFKSGVPDDDFRRFAASTATEIGSTVERP